MSARPEAVIQDEVGGRRRRLRECALGGLCHFGAAAVFDDTPDSHPSRLFDNPNRTRPGWNQRERPGAQNRTP
jgi:hypothetical protein